MRRRTIAATAVMLAAVAMVAAPSSSGAAAKKAPIKVMISFTISSPTITFPDARSGILARIRAINASGGINGRQIEFAECNDNNNPNTAVQCAQKAVQGRYAAVIGFFSVFGEQVNAVLNAAGIPHVNVAPLTPGDYKSPMSFTMGAGTVGIYGGVAHTLVSRYDCKKIALIGTALSVPTGVVKVVNAGARVASPKASVEFITVPNVNPDFSPAVASAVSKGATCFLLNDSAAEIVKAIPAIRQGAPKAKIGVSSTTLPAASIKSLGATARGIVMGDSCQPTTDTRSPFVARFLRDRSMHAKNAPANNTTFQSWTGITLLERALRTVKGTVNAASTLRAMRQIRGVRTGCGIYSYDRANKAAGYERLASPYITIYEASSKGFKVVLPLFSVQKVVTAAATAK